MLSSSDSLISHRRKRASSFEIVFLRLRGQLSQPFDEYTRCERREAQVLSKVRTETNLIFDFGTLRVTYSYKETQTRIVANQTGDFEGQWAMGSWSTVSAHLLVLGQP